MRGIELDTVIEDSRWEQVQLDVLAQKSALAVLAHLGLGGEGFGLTILGCDDIRIASLNNDFRDKPQPTNVLSWPSAERGADMDGGTPASPNFAEMAELGDIAIAYETCFSEAEMAGTPLADHTTHLLVHGILHLLGYDHERDLDATLMERLEGEILGKLGLPDPY